MRNTIFPDCCSGAERRSSCYRRVRGGFMLLEIMIAIFVFSMIVLGLVRCLSVASSSMIASNREAQIRLGLESRLAENRVQTPTLGRGTDTSDDPTVHYEHEWKQLNLENQHGQALSDLYELTEKVTWMQGNQKNEQRAEIYLYLPAPGAQTPPGSQQ